jgi:CBS domain-containing protein
MELVMAIGEYCNASVVCCPANTSVADIAGLMREHHVGDVIVVGEDEQSRVPLGIVTDRDIVIEAVAPQVDLNLITAGDIMNTPLITIDACADLRDALQRMQEFKVRRMPVVREDGTLAGILTVDDVVSMLVTQLAMVTEVVIDQATIEARYRR